MNAAESKCFIGPLYHRSLPGPTESVRPIGHRPGQKFGSTGDVRPKRPVYVREHWNAPEFPFRDVVRFYVRKQLLNRPPWQLRP